MASLQLRLLAALSRKQQRTLSRMLCHRTLGPKNDRNSQKDQQTSRPKALRATRAKE
jgi:hypothetical protein